MSVPDPQCAAVTADRTLNTLCTLDALAQIVPAGTPGSFVLSDGSNRSAQVVLQNPLPGRKGTLGQNVFRGLSTWQLDANLSKSFQISESKALQVRFDARNVLNHPQPGFAGGAFSINDNVNLGNINTKTGNRTLQGQLRLTF